ncbi:MAG: hypothetical protein ACYSR6_10410 [Planctomycetota bacterium]|jgi:hypothetical protein
MNRFVIVCFALCAAGADEARNINSAQSADEMLSKQVREVFDDTRNVSVGTWLPIQLHSRAVEKLLEIGGLDWSFVKKPKGHGGLGMHTSGIVSRNKRYCFLIETFHSEFGIGGNSRYCLMDTTGSVLWSRDGFVFGWPRLSDLGNCAIVSTDTSSIEWSSPRGPAAIVYFFGANGLLNGTWTRKRSLCRGGIDRGAGIPEVYDFSPDGEHFYISFNPENADSNKWDPICWTTYLLCIKMSGEVEWETPVGELRSLGLLFSDDGGRIVWTGGQFGGLGIEYNNETTLLSGDGKVLFRRDEPVEWSQYFRLMNSDTLVIGGSDTEELVDIESGAVIRRRKKTN